MAEKPYDFGSNLSLDPLDLNYNGQADVAIDPNMTGNATNVSGSATTVGGSSLANNGLNNAYQAQANTMNQNLENQNSTWGPGGSVDQGLGMAGKVIGGVSSLANIYLGFQNLSMAKDELKIKKDQWKESKAELNHMRATRARIGQSYTTGSAMAR